MPMPGQIYRDTVIIGYGGIIVKLEMLGKIKTILPKTPGIHGRDEFLNTVILVPLVAAGGEYHFLFEKRSPHIRQGGEVCFPGGVYDPDKDDCKVRTALRETFEETGIGEEKINVLGPLDTMVAPVGTIIDAYLGVVGLESLDELDVNHDEVEYIFTVPVSHFETNQPEVYHARIMAHPSYTDKDGNKVTLFPSEDLGVPDMYTKPWGRRDYKIYVYRYGVEIIWGITARFVYDVVNMLKQI